MFSHSELSNLFIDKRIMFVNPLINEMKIKIRGFYLSAILTWVLQISIWKTITEKKHFISMYKYDLDEFG